MKPLDPERVKMWTSRVEGGPDINLTLGPVKGATLSWHPTSTARERFTAQEPQTVTRLTALLSWRPPSTARARFVRDGLPALTRLRAL
jgi:hypothetical protein